ncbi:16S rRNA (cytosine(1402)-N(4))-methyltransferase [Sphingomonas sp. 28-63-12]|uniref:16S rRNA (cytosine(1402)-N(4))-methyltransferase RsmH n=1 Tax=Sphingomonas sp. 28-63-12 TaxID=1970434 RepID=UPI000BDCB624|nr:MAG: 16S rRNA (cytosine(1402)-N(4))-methyltransferase [Sphingomonas sp. 28-63-12]
MNAPHVPVLLDAVIAALAIVPGECHVDATFGAGGYTRAMLAKGARVIAFDRDPDAIAAGQALVVESNGALTLVHALFSTIPAELAQRDALPVDGLVMDIGVSSMQIDQPDRGFSFQSDGPLDMRMSRDGISAADFINDAEEAEIADVLKLYGEEPRARRVARAIVAARPMTTTGELAGVVRRALGYRPHDKKDPSTRTFQAIRIKINQELNELESLLNTSESILSPGGRLAVVSFHSLEDRLVKRFLRQRSGTMPGGSRHLPQATPASLPSFHITGRAVRADEEEIARNPRARSATLRAAQRTVAAPWPVGETR